MLTFQKVYLRHQLLNLLAHGLNHIVFHRELVLCVRVVERQVLHLELQLQDFVQLPSIVIQGGWTARPVFQDQYLVVLERCQLLLGGFVHLLAILNLPYHCEHQPFAQEVFLLEVDLCSKLVVNVEVQLFDLLMEFSVFDLVTLK